MADDIKEKLTRIGHKAELLVTRFKSLIAENSELRQSLDEKEAEITRLARELEQVRIENEHLRVASRVAATRESLDETRAFVSDLMREIDACVDTLVRDV